ncbi:MAG TPA: pyridoxamine 5'-phosphate oxidase family protein [Solirubrobacteraceae bacterium]|jgi:PPOX class probable F420-dependent enzyme|nr:pyridoxamine 5'-phosphate oxidase family protein [Solirubrobacteraceae bacterium]
MGRSASVAELPRWAHELLASARVARLGIVDDDGGPRVLPVTYALAGSEIVTALDHKPKRLAPERLARVRWLTARPRAALTVDVYDDDWSRLRWVQAIGPVRILEAPSAPEAIAALTERYLPYRDRPPGGPVIALRPDRVLWWRA